jgi:hypothetical protein
MPNFEERYNIYLYGADIAGLSDPAKPRPILDLGWTERVRLNLMTVSTKKIGSALLETIRYYAVPVHITKPSPGGCGAGVWGMHPFFTGFENGKATLQVQQGPILEFDPARYESGHSCVQGRLERNNLLIPGHQTLFHELVHVMRKISFKFSAKTDRLGGLAFYDSSEEFYAVMLQGIYASEGGGAIRESHTQTFEIDPALNGSFDFFKSGIKTFEFVRDFCKDHPVFSKCVAKIDTRFNPIRAYYSDPSKAKALSKSALAQQRDTGEPALKAAWEAIRNGFKRADPSAP